MTKRFIIREEVTDCNVGDVLRTSDGAEAMCTEKCYGKYKIGDNWYYAYELPEYFNITKEVYHEEKCHGKTRI